MPGSDFTHRSLTIWSDDDCKWDYCLLTGGRPICYQPESSREIIARTEIFYGNQNDADVEFTTRDWCVGTSGIRANFMVQVCATKRMRQQLPSILMVIALDISSRQQLLQKLIITKSTALMAPKTTTFTIRCRRKHFMNHFQRKLWRVPSSLIKIFLSRFVGAASESIVSQTKC